MPFIFGAPSRCVSRKKIYKVAIHIYSPLIPDAVRRNSNEKKEKRKKRKIDTASFARANARASQSGLKREIAEA